MRCFKMSGQMRVARILGAQARFYARKSFEGDTSGGSSESWTVTSDDEAAASTGAVAPLKPLAKRLNISADLVHIYGAVPGGFLRSLTIPVVFETPPAATRNSWWSRLGKDNPVDEDTT